MTKEEYKKHKQLIEEWSNGEKIQYYNKTKEEWVNTENPLWDYYSEYRIKPTKIEFKDCSFNDEEYKVDTFGKVITPETAFFNIENRINFIKDKEIAEAYAVLPQLIRLRDEYNEGWKPDWEIEYVKYYIRVYKNKWHLDYHSSAHCLLAFKTEETRDRFFEDHRDLIEIAKPFL